MRSVIKNVILEGNRWGNNCVTCHLRRDPRRRSNQSPERAPVGELPSNLDDDIEGGQCKDDDEDDSERSFGSGRRKVIDKEEKANEENSNQNDVEGSRERVVEREKVRIAGKVPGSRSGEDSDDCSQLEHDVLREKEGDDDEDEPLEEEEDGDREPEGAPEEAVEPAIHRESILIAQVTAVVEEDRDDPDRNPNDVDEECKDGQRDESDPGALKAQLSQVCVEVVLSIREEGAVEKGEGSRREREVQERSKRGNDPRHGDDPEPGPEGLEDNRKSPSNCKVDNGVCDGRDPADPERLELTLGGNEREVKRDDRDSPKDLGSR